MTTNDRTTELRDEQVERLIRLAGGGPEPAADGADRLRAAVRPAWQREVRARAHRRRIAWAGGVLAAAAGLVLALVVILESRREPPAPAPRVARVELVRGRASILSASGEATAVAARNDVAPGATLRTPADGRIALRLDAGQSLRLDGGTRARLELDGVVVLDEGAVYVDSQDAGGAGIEVRTSIGAARDVGTQFEVRRAPAAMIVRVRDGLVAVTHGRSTLDLVRGAGARIGADGSVATTRLAAHDSSWDWVIGIAPPIDIDGLSVVAFLDWVSRETGLWIHFVDPEVERFAGETVLHGSLERMTPVEAVEPILATCGLIATGRDGTLDIRRATDRATETPP